MNEADTRQTTPQRDPARQRTERWRRRPGRRKPPAAAAAMTTPITPMITLTISDGGTQSAIPSAA